MSQERELHKNYLSMVEVLALSVSIIASTLAMAFNTSSAAGAAVPLAFLVSTIAILFGGVSFVEFSRRILILVLSTHNNSKEIGSKTRFVSGRALIGTYFCYAAGCCALFGTFATTL